MYSKRGNGETLDVRPYKERLLDVRSRLAGLPYPHAWPAQRIYESDRAVFLVRQYLAANLAQRISTRPFLTLVEKVGGVGGRVVEQPRTPSRSFARVFKGQAAAELA